MTPVQRSELPVARTVNAYAGMINSFAVLLQKPVALPGKGLRLHVLIFPKARQQVQGSLDVAPAIRFVQSRRATGRQSVRISGVVANAKRGGKIVAMGAKRRSRLRAIARWIFTMM
jgi:hypothetical protein